MKKGVEEEFSNFMHRVTEINGIVRKLSSDDKEQNKMGMAEADKYLNNSKFDISEKIDEQMLKLTIKDNKTIINKIKEKTNENEMSQEAFMKEVERDANKRYADKQVRKEKAETVKLQANKAFRRGEYEKALNLYNKAINFIRDSCVLYTNRALTYMHLDFYDKALDDCDTAHKINEDSLKAWLYKSKCYYILKDEGKRKECVEEALKRHPEEKDRIHDFVDSYFKEPVKK